MPTSLDSNGKDSFSDTQSASSSSSEWLSEIKSALKSSPRDFFQPNPARYWFDFLLNLVLAYGASALYLSMPLGSLSQLCLFPIAVFWLYRLGSLVHEVCHLRNGEMTTFKIAWNLMAGVILLSPSPFFTRHHRDHHSPQYFGAANDPEYMASMFQSGSVAGLLFLFARILFTPGIVFLRFLLVPLIWLIPGCRNWVLLHASHLSMTFNQLYTRKNSAEDVRNIAIVEWLCCFRAWQILAVEILGFIDWTRLPLLYSLGLGVVILNMLRLAGDHHGHSNGKLVDMSDHVLDSCNYTGGDLMTRILFPFSIRYHALHHILPSLPYHNLSAAHEYLNQSLMASSPYRGLDQKNWWSVARKTLFCKR